MDTTSAGLNQTKCHYEHPNLLNAFRPILVGWCTVAGGGWCVAIHTVFAAAGEGGSGQWASRGAAETENDMGDGERAVGPQQDKPGRGGCSLGMYPSQTGLKFVAIHTDRIRATTTAATTDPAEAGKGT